MTTASISHRALIGPGPRKAALTLSILSGATGWATAGGSLFWLTRHDSGDPAQYVGGLWVGGVALSLVVAVVALVILGVNWKRARLRGREWFSAAVGVSYVLLVVGTLIGLAL
jgi:peptidoglycan biosynthesis protein MviN/MurJ (putative lipid II flippase)